MPYTLVPWQPCPYVEHFGASFFVGGHVECEWTLSGNMDAIRWPTVTASSGRRFGLWETTCFEWFYGPLEGDEYIEFNLSPSQDWNAFLFSSLREGMTETDRVSPLSVNFHHNSREAKLHVTIAGSLDVPGHLGLSAVIEDLEGGIHHFALAQNTPRPDFHSPDNHVRYDGKQ